MASEAHDLFGGQPPPTEQQIADYLAGKMLPDEARAVEEALALESMESDALEGLQHLSPGEAREAATHIQRGLKAAIAAKKKRGRRPRQDQRWTVIAIAVVLLLAVLCYLLIRMSAKG